MLIFFKNRFVHYEIQARNQLNETFENRRINRASPVNWPVRSPILPLWISFSEDL